MQVCRRTYAAHEYGLPEIAKLSEPPGAGRRYGSAALPGAAQNVPVDLCQLPERRRTITRVARAVHHGQHVRLERHKPARRDRNRTGFRRSPRRASPHPCGR